MWCGTAPEEQAQAGWHVGNEGEVRLIFGRLCLMDSGSGPVAAVGTGQPRVSMYRGNFDIQDEPSRIELPHCEVAGPRLLLSQGPGAEPLLELVAKQERDALVITARALAPELDRLWLNFSGSQDETIWGGGEQMSYLRLNGRRFPIWTSEPGVGRDKSDPFTQAMDAAGGAGGDYWTTNYPQPTWLSSRGYALHADISSYSVLDFERPQAPSIEIWQSEARIEVYEGATPAQLVTRLSQRFGRQPELPDWAIGGAIVGLKDGDRSFARLDRIVAAGAKVSALWCEDWCGIRETSFGRRLFWDWTWNPKRYPDLPQRIRDLESRGIRFLAYVNPYLAIDGALYREAEEAGHLARDAEGAVYKVDFGEFDAAVVDFTSKKAAQWFAERIVGREMLDLGIAGWMADFGEYLPTDCRLASGESAMLAHNRWPVLWAEVNRAAVESRGQVGNAVFFMRAGYSGVQASCPLLWAGDQLVDFSRHDGINTVITAALSAGLVGNAYSHSDCGGYTSLGGKVRSAELLMRWCELAAFAPVMRTHEGNRPDDNLQIDSTEELLACFARWSRVHAALAPYVRHLCNDASASGLPAQRALFLHYPEDRETHAIQDQFLYGADLLVAPVVAEGMTSRSVYLPGAEAWRHLWTGRLVGPGWIKEEAPISRPPVYVRVGSDFETLFQSLVPLVVEAA